jgi:hypothetical protein
MILLLQIRINGLERDSSETSIPIYQLHGVTFKKIEISVLTDMKTSNLATKLLVRELRQKLDLESGNESTWLLEHSMTLFFHKLHNLPHHTSKFSSSHRGAKFNF